MLFVLPPVAVLLPPDCDMVVLEVIGLVANEGESARVSEDRRLRAGRATLCLREGDGQREWLACPAHHGRLERTQGARLEDWKRRNGGKETRARIPRVARRHEARSSGSP